MEIYTAAQAAKILSVNERTIRRWLRSGELTGAETTVGWRLTPADLEAWLNRHRKVRPPETLVVDEDASDRAALALVDTGDFEDWQTVKARNGL